MKEEVKVGQVWIDSHVGYERKVLCVSQKSVFFVRDDGFESLYDLKNFKLDHTLKKPEPVLKKLVAWVSFQSGLVNDISTEDDTVFSNKDRYIKKELIVKDGSVYVDMSEMEK